MYHDQQVAAKGAWSIHWLQQIIQTDSKLWLYLLCLSFTVIFHSMWNIKCLSQEIPQYPSHLPCLSWRQWSPKDMVIFVSLLNWAMCQWCTLLVLLMLCVFQRGNNQCDPHPPPTPTLVNTTLLHCLSHFKMNLSSPLPNKYPHPTIKCSALIPAAKSATDFVIHMQYVYQFPEELVIGIINLNSKNQWVTTKVWGF